MAAGKPKVLVLGGIGFIGKNLVRYLVENDLASKVRVVDKVLPSMATFSKEEEAAFQRAEFVQANLVNPKQVEKAFEGERFNYVVNLAAETKYGHNDDVYKERVLDLALVCAREAAKQGADKFIEVSTAQVYDASKKAKSEDAKIKPWTNLARFKYQVEEQLREINGLNWIVVRPVLVYGPGDLGNVMARLVCGAVYKKLGEKMKFLWDKDLRINTVHVRDVVRAVWHLCQNGSPGSVFNLADKTDTDQGKVNELLEKIYGIETGFMGSIASTVGTKVSMKGVTEHVNDKHVQPWSEMTKAAGIAYTPLTPYLDPELLSNNSLAADGSAVESTGFRYEVPEITEAALREELEYWVRLNLFPREAI